MAEFGEHIVRHDTNKDAPEKITFLTSIGYKHFFLDTSDKLTKSVRDLMVQFEKCMIQHCYLSNV